MLEYRIDVLKKLKEKGYTTTILKKDYKIGDSQLAKIRNGEMIGINVLDKICGLLDMQPGSVIKYVKDDPAPDPEKE